MKRLLVVVLAGLMSLTLTGTAGATLIQMVGSNDNHVVYDDVASQYWIWDMSMFINQTYSQQISNIESLDYYGIQDWRMGTALDMQKLLSYMILLPSNPNGIDWGNGVEYPAWDATVIASSFNPTLQGEGYMWWSGRTDQEYAGSAPAHINESIQSGNTGEPPYNASAPWEDTSLDITAWESLGAWVTADALPSAVPEPSTMLLLGSGLLGLVGLNRRRKA